MIRNNLVRRLLVLAISCSALAGCDVFMSEGQRLARAEHAIQAHDYGSASVDLKKVLQRDESNALARLRLAECELAQGFLDAASTDLAKVNVANVVPADYWRTKWRIVIAQGLYGDAAKGLSSSVPGLAESERFLLLADAHLGLRRPLDAEQELRKSIELDRTNETALALLGTTVAMNRGFPEAIEVLRKGVAEFPQSFVVGHSLGDVLLRSGDLSGAEQAYRAALRLTDAKKDLASYLSGATGLCNALLAENKIMEAQGVAADAAKAAPYARASVLLVGRVAAARRDFPSALENLQKVMTAQPNNAAVRTMLASVQLETGRVEQATANLQLVIASGSAPVAAQRLLAQAYMMQGRPDEAAKLLGDSTSLGKSPDLQVLEARALLASGDSSGGLAILDRLEATSGITDGVRLDIAQLYLQAGKPDRVLSLLAGKDSGAALAGRRDQLRLVALAAKDRAAGIEALKGYAKEHGNSLPELRFAALTLSTLGAGEDARGLLESYARAHANDAAVLTTIAQVDARSGKLDEAEATLRRALEIEPKNSTRVALAQLAAARGHQPDAVRWLEQARAADAKDVTSRSLLVREYVAEHKGSEAKQVADELVAIDPGALEVQLLAARAADALRDYDGALHFVDQALHLSPNSAAAWFAKGEIEAERKQFDDARVAFRRAFEISPRQREPLVALVRLELAAGSSDRALAVARAAQQHPESKALGLLLEGDLLLKGGKAQEAAKVFAALQEMQPSSQGVLALHSAEVQARMTAPEQPLLTWLKDHPTDTSVRATLADYWRRTGNVPRAIAEYEAGLKVSPNSVALLNNLAWIYVDQNDPRALETARRAYDLAPKSPEVSDTLGWALLRANQSDDALKYLRLAGASAPNVLDIQYHLATALLRVGDRAGAQAICDRFTSDKVPEEWRKKFAALVAPTRTGDARSRSLIDVAEGREEGPRVA